MGLLQQPPVDGSLILLMHRNPLRQARHKLRFTRRHRSRHHLVDLIESRAQGCEQIFASGQTATLSKGKKNRLHPQSEMFSWAPACSKVAPDAI